MMPMNTNRVVVDAPDNTIRGPWEEQPLRSALPATIPQTDPRLELTDQALVVASQNAYPIVARQKTRRDNLGLAAGGAIALVLGCATFVSLSSGRHASTAPAATTALQGQGQQALPIPAPAAGKPMAGMPMPAATAPQTNPMPGMAHMPGAMTMPGMAPGASPVLVYDGGAAPTATV